MTLNRRDQTRLRLLNSVISEEVSVAEATQLMAFSERQVRRMLAAYRRDGARALAHGNRDRRQSNALPEGLESHVVRLAAEHYPGANYSHLTELVEERKGLRLSR
ncbi:MAG: helix-turn-helix domain-containing protein [Chloroflexi bacterium]|nr:helix-turn-helix domain-containing protein [Chloroflexota bacterium]